MIGHHAGGEVRLCVSTGAAQRSGMVGGGVSTVSIQFHDVGLNPSLWRGHCCVSSRDTSNSDGNSIRSAGTEAHSAMQTLLQGRGCYYNPAGRREVHQQPRYKAAPQAESKGVATTDRPRTPHAVSIGKDNDDDTTQHEGRRRIMLVRWHAAGDRNRTSDLPFYSTAL